MFLTFICVLFSFRRIFSRLFEWFGEFLQQVNMDDCFVAGLIESVVNKLFKLVKDTPRTGLEQTLIT